MLPHRIREAGIVNRLIPATGRASSLAQYRVPTYREGKYSASKIGK